MMAKEIKVYFCPKCNDLNVKHPFGLRNLFGIIPKWKCSNCGFQAPVFPMMVVNTDKLDKMIEKENKKVKEKGKGKAIIICPECKSENITPYMRWKGDNRYLCKNCGYQGFNFLEKIKTKSRKKK